MGDNPTAAEQSAPLPQPPPGTATAPYQMLSKDNQYKRLSTLSYVYAYILVISLIVSVIIAGMMFVDSKTPAAMIAGGLAIILTYLNYRIVSNSVNCDRQMFGKPAEFPSL